MELTREELIEQLKVVCGAYDRLRLEAISERERLRLELVNLRQELKIAGSDVSELKKVIAFKETALAKIDAELAKKKRAFDEINSGLEVIRRRREHS